MLLEVVVLVVLGTAALIAYVTWCHAHWRRRGVPTLKNTFLLGSLGDALLKKKATSDVIKDLYLEAVNKGLKFGGIYVSTEPFLLLTDPDLIRLITVKHFDQFTDRRPFAEKSVDELLSRSLLSLHGDEWREMRHHLSPAFTGSKLRGMMELMDHASRQFARFLATRFNPEEPIEMRENFRRFAADVIASTAFGTVSDSVNDPKSDFYANGIKLLDFKGIRKLIVAGYMISPRLMQKLKIKFIPEELNNYFQNIIIKNIYFREVEHMSRPDMIQLLIDGRKNKSNKTTRDIDETLHTSEEELSKNYAGNSNLSDLDIVSQAFTFFLGGFETVSTAMSFATQALAANPEVQERLRREVDVAFEQGGGKIDYVAVQGLKYMDMFLAEVLRMYPVVPFADRACTKPLNLPEFGLNLKVGDVMGMPYHGLHYNPEFFPDPEHFDPERFNEANKHNIRPFTYLPFGSGPRNCIGMRFAQLEVKLVLAYIVASCELHPSKHTRLPIRLDPARLDNAPEGGFQLTVTPRDQPSVRLDAA